MLTSAFISAIIHLYAYKSIYSGVEGNCMSASLLARIPVAVLLANPIGQGRAGQGRADPGVCSRKCRM